jgi:CRP-like cAMP-binding protein
MSPSAGRALVELPLFPAKEHSRKVAFDLSLFLEEAGPGRMLNEFGAKQTVFAQGGPANTIMYVQAGGVRLTVVNTAGKEAVLTIRGTGDFLGEECLTGRSTHTATATTIAPTILLAIEKKEMIRLLHEEREFSDSFIAHLVARNRRGEEDLIDQIFNLSEKRLARALLLLARDGAPGDPGLVLPQVSQEVLAEMVGTTRSRVNFFMKKFRKLGFLHYDGKIYIKESLQSVVQHE